MTLSCTTIVVAQYKVGDVYEKDGVKAIIYYVDDTKGEALAITVAEEKDFDATYMMRVEYKALNKNEKKEFREKIKEADKAVKPHYDRLAALTGGYGAENMKAIKAYCAKNNIDMNTYFPALVWAESLGDGWFVPGAYEARLYAEYIAYGVGKERYKGTNMKDIKKKYERLNTQLQSNAGYEELNLPTSISTSTIGRNSLFNVDFTIYKSLELREEQSRIGSFSFRSDCYYDIDAYRPLLGQGTWVLYGKVAVCVVNCSEPKTTHNEEESNNQ